MNCSACKKSLPQDNDYATCSKCKLDLHYLCAGIQSTTWKSKNAKKKAEWECRSCKPSIVKTRSASLNDPEDENEEDPTYLALKRLLEKMFKQQEDRIAMRVDNIINIVGKLEDTMNSLIDRVREVEANNADLRKEIDYIRVELECEKQYGRSKNFIVTSIPQDEREDVPEKICELLRKMNITLRKEDITAHRLPSPRLPAPIIVQCTTRATRDYVVRSARKLRPKTSLISTKQPEMAIYFNDHLTPYFSNLMKEAKEIKEQKGYRFIWLNGNKIMLRKDNSSRAIRVTASEDLERIA